MRKYFTYQHQIVWQEYHINLFALLTPQPHKFTERKFLSWTPVPPQREWIRSATTVKKSHQSRIRSDLAIADSHLGRKLDGENELMAITLGYSGSSLRVSQVSTVLHVQNLVECAKRRSWVNIFLSLKWEQERGRSRATGSHLEDTFPLDLLSSVCLPLASLYAGQQMLRATFSTLWWLTWPRSKAWCSSCSLCFVSSVSLL